MRHNDRSPLSQNTTPPHVNGSSIAANQALERVVRVGTSLALCCSPGTLREEMAFMDSMTDSQGKVRVINGGGSAVGLALSIAKITVHPAPEWVRYVITLLDKAVGQLQPSEVAQRTVLEAARLLRRQIDPEIAQQVPVGGGRLLAWQVRKVRDYIDSHITGPVLVADLCALIARSEAHFSRSFKRTFGESPHAFVIRRRLELAARYMLQTDASLSDIALRCGFTDQAHLSKLFRQSTGQTPAAWRRAGRTQDSGNSSFGHDVRF
jgi:AraC family transcriptional regulator